MTLERNGKLYPLKG
jgi:hypothetical protein